MVDATGTAPVSSVFSARFNERKAYIGCPVSLVNPLPHKIFKGYLLPRLLIELVLVVLRIVKAAQFHRLVVVVMNAANPYKSKRSI